MYRPSDSNCSTPDRAPPEEIDIPFREKWDCLSKESTKEVMFIYRNYHIFSCKIGISISEFPNV